MLRSAAEWIEVIGGKLSYAELFDVGFSQPMTDYRRIVSFRNQLAHGYRAIRDDVVWSVIQHNLPVLEREITELIASASQS